MTRRQKFVAMIATSIALTAGMAAYGQDGEALPSATDTFEPFGPAGGWNVFVNATRGTCFAERVDEQSVLQMGITEPAIFAYIGVFTQAPTDVQGGEVNSIVLEIGGREFVGEVTEAGGNIRGGFSGGYVVSRDAGFIEEVAAAQSMTATVLGREPLEIDLTGTADAIEAIRTCNAAQVG